MKQFMNYIIRPRTILIFQNNQTKKFFEITNYFTPKKNTKVQHKNSTKFYPKCKIKIL